MLITRFMGVKLLLFFLFFFVYTINAQTCCSAGAPLMSSFDIGNGGGVGRYFYLGLDYTYNSVNKLVDNNRRLINDPRSRNAQNYALKVDYSHDVHWAFSTFIPWVIQNRNTFSESENAQGIGDLILLGQYSFLSALDAKWSFTAGVKFPTGRQYLVDDRGINLSPDMQPGSGTFDFFGRIAWTGHHLFIPNFNNQTSISYRYNTANKHFGDSRRMAGRYFKSGNELIFSTSFNYLWVLKSWFVLPDFGIKFRFSAPNEEERSLAPNSGGYWLQLPLGVQFQPSEKVAVRLFSEIPIQEKLNGLQITTDMKWGVQLRYFLSVNKNRE